MLKGKTLEFKSCGLEEYNLNKVEWRVISDVSFSTWTGRIAHWCKFLSSGHSRLQEY